MFCVVYTQNKELLLIKMLETETKNYASAVFFCQQTSCLAQRHPVASHWSPFLLLPPCYVSQTSTAASNSSCLLSSLIEYLSLLVLNFSLPFLLYSGMIPSSQPPRFMLSNMATPSYRCWKQDWSWMRCTVNTTYTPGTQTFWKEKIMQILHK